jgi:hypothetical protein
MKYYGGLAASVFEIGQRLKSGAAIYGATSLVRIQTTASAHTAIKVQIMFSSGGKKC